MSRASKLRNGGGSNRAGRWVCRLRLETLEDRHMLATITVDSWNDDFNPMTPNATDGHVTLREAITAANINARVGDVPKNTGAYGDDTIVFGSSLDGTVLLDANFKGELSITDTFNLTIDLKSLNHP